jgi:hypothetical protein
MHTHPMALLPVTVQRACGLSFKFGGSIRLITGG